MPFSGDTYNLPADRPDNTETADAAVIEALLQDIKAGLSELAGRISGIRIGYADLSGLPTTLAGYGITDGQPVDEFLSGLSSLTGAANKGIYGTGANTFALFDLSGYIRGLLNAADEAAFKEAINHTSGLAQLGAVNTFTKAQRTTIVSLTDGTTITPDFSLGNDFQVTLAGNRTLANPTNIAAGQAGSIRVNQDATGSRALSYGAFYKFSAATPPVLSTGAASSDILHYKVWSETFIEISAHMDVR